MNLAQYLMMEVTPLWPVGTNLNEMKRKPISEDGKRNMRRTWLLSTIDKYQKAFLHFNNEATSLQIANYLGYNSSSMAKSLQDIMDRTTYLTRSEIPKAGRPAYLWKWNRSGRIKGEY